MKRKSSFTPDMSDGEEECRDMLPVSENPETKGVEPIKGKSSNASFDFGEFDQKLASFRIPKAEDTIKGKSSSTLFDPDEKISDFTFTEPKGVESIKGKSSSTFFGSEGIIPDFTSVKPKAEPEEEKPGSTFFGHEGKIPDFTFFEPKALESIKGQSSSTFLDSGGKFLDLSLTSSGPGVDSVKEKSSSSSGSSYDVVLDFDSGQDNKKGLKLKKSLHKHLESFEIYVSEPDIDVLAVGVTGKIFIPVFSKGFASNESCLQNLVSMVDCRSYSATNYIIPIFFGVEPSDVRLDTPLYRQSLDNLRRGVDDIVVKRWTEALTDVSNINGCFIPETVGSDEIDYHMSEVCQMVFHKLKLSLISQGTHLIGMNKDVECIIDMLNLGLNDVECLAIVGEDGLGKTTLARAVYDKLSSTFEGCSFLECTSIENLAYQRMKSLQPKLVFDLLRKKVEDFRSMDERSDLSDLIRERFCHMKVLIVLDDVVGSYSVLSLVGQVNCFGPGSRIIITSRRYTPFNFNHWEYYSYFLSAHRWGSLLPSEEAFHFFKHHAFPKSYSVPNFFELPLELSQAFVRLSDYHPFDMEIVGSLLYGKNEAEWESILLHLRQQDVGFFKDLNGILRMCYGSLTEKQKQIFLDISCLPDGMDRQITLLLWDDYSLHSQSYHDFEVLIRLSLMKIDANDRIRMHRLVKNFSREITRDPQHWRTNRTGSMRFFKMACESIDPSDIAQAQQRNIIFNSQFPKSVEADHHAKHLKVLDLSWSKITENWETWSQIKAPELRVLKLTGCVDLMVTPNFSFCPDLEILILEHCSQLVEIDPSIQELQKLAILNLRYCTELSVLPKEIGRLNALKELLVDGTSIQEIPVSISHLKKLQVLTTISCSSLTQLPSSTCDLLFITALKLDSTKIAEIPCSILRILKLQYLSLRNCRHITNIGSFVGEVERSLIELDISGTSIIELPKSISKLRNLRVLKMDYCFIKEFPPGFGELKKLEEVHASRCKRLESLPHDIGVIESLQILKVGHSRISGLPKSIQLLERLEILDCTSCNKLQGLPELPASLTFLHVQSKEFKALPDLQNLVNLKEFTLGNDAIIIDSFDWLKSSNALRTLALCLPHTKNLPGFPLCLKKLTLQCTYLKQIPSLPSTLVSISIQNFRLLKKFPSIQKLENLREMEVVCCPEIKKIPGLGRLKQLRILTVSDCGIEHLGGLEKIFSLRRLTLQNCQSLSELPTVRRLEKLLEMKIIGCSRIERIEGLGRLKSLEVLSISNCGIRSLNGLDELNSLRRLTVTDCVSLRQVPDLSNSRTLHEKCVLLEDPQIIIIP